EQIPTFKVFRLQQNQQQMLTNPNIFKALMVEIGSKASFFAQQNTLTVHLHNDPSEIIWKQIEDTLSKHTGKLTIVEQHDVILQGISNCVSTSRILCALIFFFFLFFFVHSEAFICMLLADGVLKQIAFFQNNFVFFLFFFFDMVLKLGLFYIKTKISSRKFFLEIEQYQFELTNLIKLLSQTKNQHKLALFNLLLFLLNAYSSNNSFRLHLSDQSSYNFKYYFNKIYKLNVVIMQQ
ncbi:hypothetical protein RFI_00174, partial [Reticulomyxa filosa]